MWNAVVRRRTVWLTGMYWLGLVLRGAVVSGTVRLMGTVSICAARMGSHRIGKANG